MPNLWYTVQPEETPVESGGLMLGAFFFFGSRMQFNSDGTFEVTFPEVMAVGT